MEILKINTSQAGLMDLLIQSDELMASLYPAESNHMVSLDALGKSDISLFGIIDQSKLIGVGSFKHFKQENYAEIKRVFIAISHRGKGLSTKLMNHLHDEIKKCGFESAKLETGIKQPQAIGLYKKLGYKEILPFGEYSKDPLSIFMQLDLS